jgi:hypothetical protein
MKLKATVEFDTATGQYEIQFNNLSNPGGAMDRDVITEGLMRILKDFTGQTAIVEEKGKRRDN